ncbi:hypothetical protein WJX73_000316 [Symbiochloris irregularis]|uniref:Uncharacterized protein n=1 Tax=Symbiochloris irregularis TaxID=706552 RepID=A0AAW1PTX4_9CHLO
MSAPSAQRPQNVSSTKALVASSESDSDLRGGSSHRQGETACQDMLDIIVCSDLPPYLAKLYGALVALTSGQPVAYLYDNFLDNLRDLAKHRWSLLQQVEDPLTPATTRARAHAEMKAIVAATRAGIAASLRLHTRKYSEATLAVVQSNAAHPLQTVLRAHRAQMEDMQLSITQAAECAAVGAELFADLRTLRKESSKHDGQAAVTLRNAEMLAVARSTGRICCEEWLSDEQFIRMGAQQPHSAVMPNDQIGVPETASGGLATQEMHPRPDSSNNISLLKRDPILQSKLSELSVPGCCTSAIRAAGQAPKQRCRTLDFSIVSLPEQHLK